MIGELLDAGLMHPDVDTVAGHGLGRYRDEPYLDEADELRWRPAPRESRDPSVAAPARGAFAPDGGIRVLDGGLGRAVMKVSAVAPEHRVVTAPARVFDDQGDFLAAFDRGDLDGDLVAVVRHQGPRANGMPELHKLTPALGVLMDRGHRVALVTDGRMSGASGKVPAALHCTPEAAAGGPLSRLRDGDVVRVDAETGRLEVDVDLHDREPWIPELTPPTAPGASCSPPSATASAAPTRARRCSPSPIRRGCTHGADHRGDRRAGPGHPGRGHRRRSTTPCRWPRRWCAAGCRRSR